MYWQFGDYRLDEDNECLWQGEQRLALRPKTFELLRYLVEHADQLVSKETLMQTIWSDTVVVEGVLTTSIGELRKLFGETAKAPRFIATEHRRGYRFIAPVNVLKVTNTTQTEQVAENNLARTDDTFIGRKAELVELRQLILAESRCRLLTLLGPGGIGKTRLVRVLLDELLNDSPAIAMFSDGLFFIQLQSLADAQNLPATIAETIGFRFSGTLSAQEQLIAHLHTKRMLLVLDNFEHLLAGSELIAATITNIANSKLVITSREALGLSDEWIRPVNGIHYPRTNSATDLAEYDACKLFEQCALKAGFAFNQPEQKQQVSRICQLVAGMPLAIELAAAWLKVLSPKEIADEVEKNIDILTAQHRDIPERHRSIKAIFTQSWQRLSIKEQTVLKKLAVFHGGCTRAAVEQIAEVNNISILTGLVDKALLRYTVHGRYELHQLVHQFAEEKLLLIPEEYAATRIAHSNYYIHLLESQESALEGKSQLQSLNTIAVDLDNIRLAWQWIAEKADLKALNRSLRSLFLFYEMRGLAQEGEVVFKKALDQINRIPVESLSDNEKATVGQLLARRGNLMIRIGQYNEGIDLMKHGASLLRKTVEIGIKELVWVLSYIGEETYFQGNSAEARRYLHESYQLSTKLGAEKMQGTVALHLGELAEFQGEYVEAEPFFQQSLAIFEKHSDYRNIAFAINNWARVAYAIGDYGRAATMIRKAFKIRRRLNDHIGIAYSLLDMGKLSIARGKYESAWQYLQRGLDFSIAIGERDLQARIHNGLGLALSSSGKWESAKLQYQKALAIYQEIGVLQDIPYTLNGLGRIALKQGNLSAASKLFEDSLSANRELNNKSDTAYTLLHLAHIACLVDHSDLTQACQLYSQAITILSSNKAIPMLLDAFIGIAQLAMLMNDRQTASKLLTLAYKHPSGTYNTKQEALDKLTYSRVFLSDQPILELEYDIWQVVDELQNNLSLWSEN